MAVPTTSITFTTNSSSLVRRDGLNTKVVELAAGYVGVVLATVNGNDVPIADTKPRKTYGGADRAVRKLALKVAKRGL